MIVCTSARFEPVFDISFPSTEPRSIDSERNRLKPSHFSPLDELPYYIPVLENLVNMIDILVRSENKKHNLYMFAKPKKKYT
jgi:hypothetical protein